MSQPTTVTKSDVWNALRRISAADNREQLTASEEQHITGLLKSLLATGVALSASFLTETDEAGLTVAHVAAQAPHILKCVLDFGAPADAFDSAGHTALQVLCRQPTAKQQSIAVLLAAGASCSVLAAPSIELCSLPGGWQPLHFAATNDDSDAAAAMQTVDLLLQHDVPIDALSEGGDTAAWLVAHCAGGQSTACERLQGLFDRGADKAHYDEDGWSLLHAAAHSGNTQVMDLLHRSGVPEAVYTTPHTERETPLHIAAERNHIDMCQLLLTAGADKQALDDRGFTPLRRCLSGRANDATTCKFLIAAGCDPFEDRLRG
jgi:ankyrin repeat protein